MRKGTDPELDTDPDPEGSKKFRSGAGSSILVTSNNDRLS
jgi:hypothetical protein